MRKYDIEESFFYVVEHVFYGNKTSAKDSFMEKYCFSSDVAESGLWITDEAMLIANSASSRPYGYIGQFIIPFNDIETIEVVKIQPTPTGSASLVLKLKGNMGIQIFSYSSKHDLELLDNVCRELARIIGVGYNIHAACSNR